MVGFTFYSENRTCPYILAGLRGKVWGLILPFTPVLDIIFFANLQAWLRSPSDVYPHIMCFGIPCFIICISTTQSFPQGSMYVWLCVTHCQAYGALSINTVIMMNEGILDHLEFISSVMVNFSVLRGPMTPCLFPVLPDGATSSSACCEHILVVKNWDPNPSKGRATEAYPCQFTLCSTKFPFCSPWEWLP